MSKKSVMVVGRATYYTLLVDDDKWSVAPWNKTKIPYSIIF